jgi:hypothetical protein
MKDTKIRITIDVFSGRRNPVVEFKGKRLQNIVKRLAPTKKMEEAKPSLPPIPTLGFRGMIVEQEGAPISELSRSFRVADGFGFGSGFAYRLPDEAFEDFVCRSLPKEFDVGRLKDEIQRYKHLIDFWNKLRWPDDFIALPKKKSCKCAPIYEPTWWNVPERQYDNNCYNYACNYRTDTYAQPGYAAGEQYSSINCNSVRTAAIKDKLIDSPGSDNKCPEEGHLVALVVGSSGWDYHWYRKGKDGYWSHKPGGGAVTNLDNSGNLIPDPRTADRNGYDEFCTFMVVKHGHIKIDGPF